jgi:N-acetylmuramoyl-L-alanine amidase
MIERRLASLAHVLCAFVVLTASARAASDWHVVKVGSRDYLTLKNIAEFYGLPTDVQPSGPQGKTLNLANARGQLQVTAEGRECTINGVRNWLSFPVMMKDGQFLMSRVDLAKTVEPQLRPHMIQGFGKVTTIVLDPGHGGHDKGACSTYGCEKDYTLDIATQLKPLLEAKGFKVVMTRDSDVFIPLDVRAKIANATRDSVFVSIHLNATDWNPAAAGFEIYSLTPRGAPSTQDEALALRFFQMQIGSRVDAPSLALSMSIYHSVLGQIPEPDRGIKRARFAVLRLTRIPAVLVEGGFLTERSESRLIANSQWRAKYAQAIADGLQNYKLLAEKRQRPMLLADYRRQLGGELFARDATKPDDSAALIPASNTQHDAATLAPQAGTGARSEQEQDEAEPAPVTAMVDATLTPAEVAAAGSPIASDGSATPEESTPDNTPPMPTPENRPTVAEHTAADPAPAKSPTAPTAPPLRQPSLGERILRWVPMLPTFRP